MVTLSAAEVARHTILGLAPSIEAAEAIQERLAQGESAEDILKEWAVAVQDRPEGKGLAHILSAGHHLGQEEPQEALKAYRNARQAWPEAGAYIRSCEANCLTVLKRYDEAFAAFQGSAQGLLLLSSAAQERYPFLASWGQELWQDFYQNWALVGIAQGLEGLTRSDVAAFEAGGEKVIAVLRAAKEGGHEDAVWAAMDKLEQALPPEQRPLMEELRLYVRLGVIDDPFERWKALGEEISKVWPEGGSAVEAAREQRE